MSTGILQVTPIFLPLLGDGVATTFTIAPANIPFAGVPGLNTIIPLEGAFLHNESIVTSGLTGVASVDVYGNLTVTFSSPIQAGITVRPQIDLYVASGAVVATTVVWNNTTVVSTSVSILLGVAIPALNVVYNPTGTVFGGATVQFETSIDGGANWLPIFGTISTSGGIASSSLLLTSTASIIQFNVAGFTNFRVRLSSPIIGAGIAEFGLLGSKLATNVTLSGGWVTGTLSENTAAPSNTNFGVLPAVANAVAQPLTEGRQVLLSTDLSGNLRTVAGTAIRTNVTLYIDAAAGITSEALESMSINKGGTVTTGTSYTVSAGKTFRIQNITMAVQETNGTVQTSKIRVRSAATVSASSPIFYANRLSTGGATNQIGEANPSFADGLEFAAGQQVGVSHIESTTSSNLTVTITGYEY